MLRVAALIWTLRRGAAPIARRSANDEDAICLPAFQQVRRHVFALLNIKRRVELFLALRGQGLKVRHWRQRQMLLVA